MPCRDDGRAEEDARKERGLLREMLCEACGIADMAKASGQLRQWWTKHQAEDAARRFQADEKAKMENITSLLLTRLSSEEIEALRLKGFRP